MISRTDIEAMNDGPDASQALVEATKITMTYRNWRGVVAQRTILPLALRFGKTDWHPEPGWLLDAWDCDKGERRDFALADCQFADLARPSQAGDADRVQAMRDANWRPSVDYWRERAMKAEAALAAMDTPKGGGDGWQPIETAPKDGTSVLTFPNYRVTHYEADPAECVPGPGWVASWVDGLDAYITMRNEPTHWMPLPAPPATMKDGGDARLEAQREHDAGGGDDRPADLRGGGGGRGMAQRGLGW